MSLDTLSRMLLPYGAAISAAVFIFKPRRHWTRAKLVSHLYSTAVLLAAFASRDARIVSALCVASLVPGFVGRVPAVYLSATAAAWLAGIWMDSTPLLVAAVAARIGLVPLHSWMPELYERGSLPTAILLTAPQLGTYAAVRLFADGGPPAFGMAATVTAVYAAGLALVQRDARRMFAFLLMSQSALAVAGLEGATEEAAIGGLTAWLATGLAMTGFGLTILALEARRGTTALDRLHGGYDLSPVLAACFLLLGLAAVGLPGTLGFVGLEMIESQPGLSAAGIAVATLNGITVMRTYFALFCGARPVGLPEQRIRRRERLAALGLTALLFAGGLWPGPVLKWAEKALRELTPAATGK